MTASRRLSENVVNRIFAGGLRPLYERFAKADFLEFIGFNAMLTDVLNPILRPDELVDGHSRILGKRIHARNASAERLTMSRAEPRVFCAAREP